MQSGGRRPQPPTVLMHWPQLLGHQPFVKHPSVARADAAIANGKARRSPGNGTTVGGGGGGGIFGEVAPLPAHHRGVGSAAHAALVAAHHRQAAAYAPRPLLVHASARGSSSGVASNAPTSTLDLFPTFLAAAAASATSPPPEIQTRDSAFVHSGTPGSNLLKSKKAKASAGKAKQDAPQRLSLQRDGMNLLPLLSAAARFRSRHAAAFSANNSTAHSSADATNPAHATANANASAAATAAADIPEKYLSHPALSTSIGGVESALTGVSSPSFVADGIGRAETARAASTREEGTEAEAWARALFSRVLLFEAPRPVGAKLMPDGGVNPNFVAMNFGRYKVRKA